MITKLTLKNFRNFENSKFLFCREKNFIIWENWKWKTNILEAISLLSSQNLTKIDFKNLVWKSLETFFIEIEINDEKKIAISYDKKLNKKNYFLNTKKTTKNNLIQNSIQSVLFSPMTMNLLYLSPSLRRDFLDNILANTFKEYSKYYKEYKNILQSRNKTLKAINEKKAKIEEIYFWNKKFTNISKIIYNYRFWIVDFFKKNISQAKNFFLWKINKIDFEYITKVDKKNIWETIENYLNKNLNRDIILWTTQIWPHIDDFKIIVDDKNVIDFWSRWEVKSIIIQLKLLEIEFIKKYLGKTPILLIDDFLSELDSKHKDLILNNFNNYQFFITSIEKKDNYEWNFIYL